MAVVTLLCICLVRNLSVERVSKKQLILETAVGGMNHFFEEIIGKEGKRYIPYLMSVGIYIGIANLIGLLGFKPPTKDMNVTAALAEYFMHKGKDVLIVYDDLSKHAVAYRALSLLLERSPGREAYPGDVFYLHSRLLERSSRLSDELGGGSITALPIIETQAGDVSAYIPTNVISITDGQIFLESDLFFAGMRPAVNVGLSVSRVGGAAQTKAMKKVAGSIRIDLAQFREMEVFTQFSSDLDAATKEQLQYGKGLMELLKQPLCHPMSLHEQVITLCVATHKVLVDVEISKIKDFQKDMLNFFEIEHAEIVNEIEEKKVLSDELIDKIVELAKEFKSRC